MGAHQSKEELVYQQVNYGNIDGIKGLRRDGAGLEWIDKEGKTPLMLACMRPDLLNVAKVLIELGANVNAYRPGSHAGTPLHHAAKRGLDQTVNLLLSNGANPLVMNDDCQTPLDLARAKDHCNVVRAIENRICLFCGWLRELYGPSILEALAPQWVQRKIWAVVLPCDSRNPMAPSKFELAIYPDLQVAKPRVSIALWKVQIEEPKYNQSDPSLVIVDKASSKYDLLPYGLRTRARSLCGRQSYKRNHPRHLMHHKPVCPSHTSSAAVILDESNIPKEAKSGKKGKKLPNLPHFETRYKFLSAYEGDKQQLQWFYNACRGISQQSSYVLVAPLGAASTANPSHQNSNTPAALVPQHSPVPEDVQLAMAINASIQSALAEGVPVPNAQPVNLTANTSGWLPSENSSYNSWAQSSGASPPSKLDPTPDPYNGWSGVRPSSSSPQLHNSQLETPTVLPSAHEAPAAVSVPSAPPIVEETFYSGPIQYPTIDASPVDLTVPDAGSKTEPVDSKEGGSSSSSGASSSCVICLDAPVEGACIPCGHMAGCMSCLNEIEGKKWGCPVCRANIDKVIRLYAV